MQIMFVICWFYRDNSNNGIVRAYKNREDAEELLKILQEHGNLERQFHIKDVELFDA